MSLEGWLKPFIKDGRVQKLPSKPENYNREGYQDDPELLKFAHFLKNYPEEKERFLGLLQNYENIRNLGGDAYAYDTKRINEIIAAIEPILKDAKVRLPDNVDGLTFAHEMYLRMHNGKGHIPIWMVTEQTREMNEKMEVDTIEDINHLVKNNNLVESLIEKYKEGSKSIQEIRDELDFAGYILGDTFNSSLEQYIREGQDR